MAKKISEILFKVSDPDFDLRLQDWLDGRMSDSERVAFEHALATDSEKATMANKLKIIDADLKHLNEAMLEEKVPERLINLIRFVGRKSGECNE